jgi:hypothetical protein
LSSLERSAKGMPDDRLARLIAVALAGGRLAIGAGIWLAPRFVARSLGFGEPGAAALALGRIAATRDLVLGTWQARALDDRDEMRRATRATVLADAGDALTFALALRDDEGRTAGIRGLAGALPATLAGLWLIRRLRVNS